VRLPNPAVLVISDRRQARMPIPDIVAAACAAGCRWFSLREKDLAADEQVALAESLVPITRRFGARLTLHGDPALAASAGVDGVHLPAGGDVARAREMLGEKLIGISIHGAGEAAKLDPAFIDYAIAGPAYETESKCGYGPALGPQGIAAIVGAAKVPILAIGGISATVVHDMLRNGAAGVAVMGSIMRSGSPAAEVERLLAAFASARPVAP
jgi:thiamine-phosphate pyrophosphorylase